jgi:sRNA-binding carbon storage regulator CsrA
MLVFNRTIGQVIRIGEEYRLVVNKIENQHIYIDLQLKSLEQHKKFCQRFSKKIHHIEDLDDWKSILFKLICDDFIYSDELLISPVRVANIKGEVVVQIGIDTTAALTILREETYFYLQQQVEEEQ